MKQCIWVFLFCGLQTKSEVEIRSNRIRERKNPRSPRLDWWERIQRPKANWRESLIGFSPNPKNFETNQNKQPNTTAQLWVETPMRIWREKWKCREREGDWPSRTELRERRPPPRNDNWHLTVTGEECRATNLGG